MEPQINKSSKFKRQYIISFSILLIIYISATMYFRNHFYLGSAINCINVSGKTVEELDKEMETKASQYILELEGRGGIKEQLKAADIGLIYNGKGKSQALKDDQNTAPWIYSFFTSEDFNMNKPFIYDENLLKECFDKLSFLDSKNIIEPKNAGLVYSESGYQIVKEIEGTKVNRNILYSKVVEAILSGKTKINLDSINCYVNPKYIAKSQKLIDTKNTLDKYIAAKITYSFNEGKEVLDGTIIHDWLIVDDNLTITFDENKMKDYVRNLVRHYNTFGKKRNFKTSLGTTVKVSGGNYGWLVNVNEEIKDIIATVKEGKTIDREPVYSQTAVSHNSNDIGNTYVEINLTKQHLWFYKNGKLVTEGDVVTGNVSKKLSTPIGVYRLNYKKKDATLEGDDYSVPVTYWMPFNRNIGIHDAYWRKKFGGKIYLTNGSHGCINAPASLAKKIFYNITAGTPVVCYQ